ncbi:MAG TPA: hypothetical protein H9857_08915, partial [Candidatus Desulfovibrio intestinigallinarum]|nr:hypothetical protein [Candidatus Desulfovibrio intestinigallinarum]
PLPPQRALFRRIKNAGTLPLSLRQTSPGVTAANEQRATAQRRPAQSKQELHFFREKAGRMVKNTRCFKLKRL